MKINLKYYLKYKKGTVLILPELDIIPYFYFIPKFYPKN